ncbi:MAG: hypothetical protein ACLTLQ_05875 [[Clostridium] scindens]
MKEQRGFVKDRCRRGLFGRTQRRILRLSDAYTVPEESPALELEAVMLNINEGKNRQLMESCRTLSDYARYTQRVRGYARVMEISAAVERAVTECIAEGILSEFLSKNRAEASKVSIYEYDEEKHMRQVREEGQMDGRNEGRSEGDDDDKIRLNQRKPSKYKGLSRFGPEKNLQRINKFMKERPIFYKNLIQMKENFRFYLRCFYCITKVVILQFNSENRTELIS